MPDKTGKPTTAETVVQQTVIDSADAAGRTGKLISGGTAIGATIGGPAGAVIGNAIGGFAAGISEIFDPSKTVFHTDYSKFGMPYCPDATVKGDDGSLTLFVPDASAKFPKERLLAEVAKGFPESLESMVDAGMACWCPDESTPFNDLLFALSPALAGHRFPGPWDSDFVMVQREIGGPGAVKAPTEDEVRAWVKDIRTVWYARNVRADNWYGAPFDKRTVIPSVPQPGAPHPGRGYLCLLRYCNAPQDAIDSLVAKGLFYKEGGVSAKEVVGGLLTLGASVGAKKLEEKSNYDDVEFSKLFSAPAAFSHVPLTRPKGSGFPGAWQFVDGDPTGASSFTFRCWLSWTWSGNGPDEYGRNGASIPVTVSSDDWLDIYGTHAAVLSALKAGSLAWRGNKTEEKVTWRWVAINARMRGEKYTGPGAFSGGTTPVKTPMQIVLATLGGSEPKAKEIVAASLPTAVTAPKVANVDIAVTLTKPPVAPPPPTAKPVVTTPKPALTLSLTTKPATTTAKATVAASLPTAITKPKVAAKPATTLTTKK
jgi:hypothetical protein